MIRLSKNTIIRTDPREHSLWTRAAKMSGFKSLSAWLRSLANREVDRLIPKEKRNEDA